MSGTLQAGQDTGFPEAAHLSANGQCLSNCKLFDVMTKGSGDARMQPLYFLITTAGNIKPGKEKSTEKIDGAVATIMALDRAIRCGNDTTESVYDSRGLLFL